MLWTLLLLLSGLLVLFNIRFTRKRNRNEPPLDKGLVPWLGHALEFGRDAVKFMQRMKEKHGDVFTVCVAGHYMTVLLDPNSFDDVLRDTVNLDFGRIRGALVKRIFGLETPSVEPGAERRWMEQHFKDVNVWKLNSRMNTHLRHLLLSERKSDSSPSQWKRDGLFSLCYSLLFRAGYMTLFESDDGAAAVYREFRKFDELLTKLARNTLKREERKTAKICQERLWEHLSPQWLSGEQWSDSWKQSYQDFLKEQGVDPDMQTKALLLQLWTTQCNAGPAAFWLLGFLLTHPEAMRAVRSEIRGFSALRDISLERLSSYSVRAHSTPVFDSVLSETLRLTAAVMIHREVVHDKTLVMANGEKHQLRRGDRVCLFPLVSPQMDPEIHQEPQTFKYDRFLNGDKTVKTDFYKNGKRLTYCTMPWGAGGSGCVGKEFAVNAIKQFVFLILTHLDLELCDPDAQLPPFNSNRYGFGMVQPNGDLEVRFRLKNFLHEM